GSPGYDALHRWIAAGLPRTPTDAPKLLRITVEPTERILAAGGEQHLLVAAHYNDCLACDGTHLATFSSNERPIAAVSPDGLIKAGPLPSETAVMARFMEKFAVCNISIPLAGKVPLSCTPGCRALTSSTDWSGTSCSVWASNRPNPRTIPHSCAALTSIQSAGYHAGGGACLPRR